MGISSLDSAAPLSSAPASEGAAELRALKDAVKTSFPGFTAGNDVCAASGPQIDATVTGLAGKQPLDTTLTALIAAARAGSLVALRTKSYASGTGFDGDCTLSVANGLPLKGQNTFEFTATANDDNRVATLNS